MDSDKKFYGIVVALIILLGVSVFFLFTVLGGSDSGTPTPPPNPTPTDNTDQEPDVSVADPVTALTVSITNRGDAILNSDGSYTVSYRVAIQNVSEYTVKTITAKNNLAARFAPHTIEILEKSANNLTINNRFNGVSNIDLLFGGDTLEAGESGYIDVTFKLTPTSPIESLAEFTNGVNVDGDIVYPDNGGDNGGGSGDNTGGSGGGSNNGGDTGGSGGGTTYVPEDDLTPREFTFELINVDTGEVIRTIQPGEVIDFADIGTDNVTVRGVPGIGTRGSVVFDYNGVEGYRNENTAPYSISGNPTSTTYGPWNYTLGPQEIGITAFTDRDGQGQQIGGGSISFSFADSRTEAVSGDNFGEGDPNTSQSAVVNVNIPGSGTDTPDDTETPTDTTTDTETDTTDNTSNNGTTGNTANSGGTTTPTTLPSTGILDNNLVVLLTGLAFIAAGFVVYQTRYFTSILNKLFLTHLSDSQEEDENRLKF